MSFQNGLCTWCHVPRGVSGHWWLGLQHPSLPQHPFPQCPCPAPQEIQSQLSDLGPIALGQEQIPPPSRVISGCLKDFGMNSLLLIVSFPPALLLLLACPSPGQEPSFPTRAQEPPKGKSETQLQETSPSRERERERERGQAGPLCPF